MNKNESIVSANKSTWNQIYAGSPRIRYPDVWLIHFLMKYTPWKTIEKALCIGSGDGADAFAIARLGAQVECYDISEESVQRLLTFAKEENLGEKVSTRIGDQRNLDSYQENTFDLVTSWSVISYLSKPDGQKSIEEIFRVLKPGGHFIGILESSDHTGYLQEGVKHIENKTYQMPGKDNQTKANLIMTYYDRSEVDAFLKPFRKVSISHRLFLLPPDAKSKVGQWMFCCMK